MKIRRGGLALWCGLLLAGGTLLTGADPAVKKGTDSTKSKVEKKVSADADEGPVKGKLPNNFGKLDLSDEQRQTIYKIQDKYDDEINRLEAKLKELKGTRQKEVEGVLTKEQQSRLKLLKEGGKPAAAKSAGKTSPAKPASK